MVAIAFIVPTWHTTSVDPRPNPKGGTPSAEQCVLNNFLTLHGYIYGICVVQDIKII